MRYLVTEKHQQVIDQKIFNIFPIVVGDFV